MTVDVISEECRISGHNDIKPYNQAGDLVYYYSQVTERRQDGGNDIYCLEDVSWHGHKKSLHISNNKFKVNITHKSYEILARAMLKDTDLLVDAIGWLTEFGFEIKMPDPKSPESDVFKDYHSHLGQGAKRRWSALFRDQKYRLREEGNGGGFAFIEGV